MTVISEEAGNALKRKAIAKILETEPSRFGELTRQQVDEARLIEFFDRLSPHDQIQAFLAAGVTLVDFGYGFPSDATVAKFGNDGKMRSQISIVEDDGHTYES